MFSHLPYIPQGSIKSEFVIGSPISPDEILPLYFFKFSFNRFPKTSADIPVVYEFIKKNNGLSVKTFEHNSIKSEMLFSNCHTSPRSSSSV